MPSWSLLCKLAATQVGYFTGAQAASAGFSPQLLQYYIQKSLVERRHRGVFHLTRYPREREDLMVMWLWSKGQGVFSHETALCLHGLVDKELRHPLTLTLPEEWRRRRVRLPEPVHLFYGEVDTADRVREGPFLVTSPLRTLVDCLLARLEDRMDREVVERAMRLAVRRKLVSRKDVDRQMKASIG